MISPLRLSIAASSAAVLTLVLASGGMSRSTVLVERQMSSAFDRIEQQRGAGAGSLDRSMLHLSRLPEAGAADVRLAIGDRITLAGRVGGARDYEVKDVRPLVGMEDAAAGGGRLLLVVAVDKAAGHTIRLIVDADAQADALVPWRAATPPQPL